jgi:hypothetical protein
MTYREMEPLIQRYLDELLDAPALRQIEKHLDGCNVCSEVLKKTVETVPGLKFTTEAVAEYVRVIGAAKPKIQERI